MAKPPFKRKRIFNFMIRWLCPIFAAIILLSSVQMRSDGSQCKKEDLSLI